MSNTSEPQAGQGGGLDRHGAVDASENGPLAGRRVAILYNEPIDASSAADQDVLVQMAAVGASLKRLGAETLEVSCTLDLASIKARLEDWRPDVVFNLVESLGGSDRLMVLATTLLDAMYLPYAGCSTDAISSSTNKLLAKRRLHDAGLPTAPWKSSTTNRVGVGSLANSSAPAMPYPCQVVLKTVFEHASFGLGDDAVVEVTSDDLLHELLARQEAKLGRPCFAEWFIDGREFNVSVLAAENFKLASQIESQPTANRPTEISPSRPAPTGPFDVLPPAEIDFRDFPDGKPRIVGFQAKWEEDSIEYRKTLRTFDFADCDQPLLAELCDLAGRCWNLFDLGGFVRVDFRVDSDGRPWILEINSNPCVSPDAGFAAAVEQAGLTYDDAIRRIVEAAYRK